MERSEVFGEEGARLVGEANELAKDVEREHRDFIDAIRKQQDGSNTTTVTLVEGFEVECNTQLDGRILDALSDMESDIRAAQEGDATMSVVKDTAHKTAYLLSDIIVDDEYDHELFLHVYREEGIEVLGTFLERIFTAIGEVKESQQEAADGFRS
jgi:hypothetical protein